MVTFLGFLFIAISIAFIIGLVNPSLILRWSKKPTRGKVFLLYILFTSAIIFFIAVIAPVEQQSSSASENDEDVKSLEERKDTTIILGELKIDENVISHGKETEVSVMKRMLNETDFDKINIELIEVSNAYGKQKVIYEYDAKKKTLRCYNLKMMSVCEQQNIDKETFKSALNNGLKTFALGVGNGFLDYNKEASENLFISLAGEKPEQESNLAVPCVRKYIRSISYNPQKVEFLKWWKVVQDTENLCWTVKCEFKASNKFDVMIPYQCIFKIRNNEVIDMEIQN